MQKMGTKWKLYCIIKLTCKPFSWALCSISRTAETSSSEHPSSWRCNISSNAISTCSETSPNLECKLFGHSVVRIQWNSVTIQPTQATIVWTHQCWRDVWITREVYAYITTDITSSWGLITTKKYWNTRRVYLGHKCIWTKVRMMLDKGLKNKKHRLLTCPCLKRRICIIFVSKSLLKNPTKWISCIYIHRFSICKNK